MSSCQLMFPGVKSSLESGFGLKPPASSYRSFFYSSFKTSPSIQHRIEKMQERFNKDLEEIKKSQYIMNNAINDIKNTLEGKKY